MIKPPPQSETGTAAPAPQIILVLMQSLEGEAVQMNPSRQLCVPPRPWPKTGSCCISVSPTGPETLCTSEASADRKFHIRSALVPIRVAFLVILMSIFCRLFFVCVDFSAVWDEIPLTYVTDG